MQLYLMAQRMTKSVRQPWVPTSVLNPPSKVRMGARESQSLESVDSLGGDNCVFEINPVGLSSVVLLGTVLKSK